MASEGYDELNSVIESLMTMFSGVLNKDAIIAVAESCGGDLNLSVDAIMNITNDGNKMEDDQAKSEDKDTSSQVNPGANDPSLNENLATNAYSTTIQNPAFCSSTSQVALPPNNVSQEPSTSYSAAFQKYGAVPKTKTKLSPIKGEWNDQVRRIIENHNKGSRILILMRGAPGSGKTHLAQKIIEMVVGGTYVNFRTHICSTDDYFMSRGKYYFNKYNLSEAHAWNQNRSTLAMHQGLSPIVIDNTNIEIWEMEPYVRNGVQNGYIIEVVEPNTPWARKSTQLARKNVHNVPITTIRRMLDNYENNVTGDFLVKYFKLTYPSDKIPPVVRLMPEFSSVDSNTAVALVATKPTSSFVIPDIQQAQNIQPNIQQFATSDLATSLVGQLSAVERVVQTPEIPKSSPETKIGERKPEDDFEILDGSNLTDRVPQESEKKSQISNQYLAVQQQVEEIEKVEQEWENGEDWEEVLQTSSSKAEIVDTNCPKPPRYHSNTESNLIDVVNKVQDWQQISMFMPPWHQETKESVTITAKTVETTSSGTSMESGDFNQSVNNFKVLSTTPRDINFFHITTTKEKIPDKRMLDKGTVTNDGLLTEASRRCLNEEKHFDAFRKLFKNINKSALRDIFDQCMGDVNWAVEIVLDGVAANQIETVEQEDISDDEGCAETCTCLSAYNIIPDSSSPQQTEATLTEQDTTPVVTESALMPKKSSKRDVSVSDASVELKRQIEQNVVISESHYSQHCLKIMRFRRGYPENPDNDLEEKPYTSETPEQSAFAAGGSDEEEDSTSSVEEVEKTVNITLGKEFIAELDMLFGRTDMSYPDSLVPKINIPVTLLNEINALWMESLMHQLDEHERQRVKMFQEDEDFARELALKEAELAMKVREPEVLDFKEIMDMDLALSLYQRDVAGWRNKEPNDLAAKLSRDKLYNLFPDVPNEILAELLMAHDNNFQSTVEVLLMSTGKADILKEKNGVNKFVMDVEMERQAKIMDEERKALSEVEWPLLPKGEVPDMEAVNEYRNTADRHLHSRNMNIQKASDYLSRGMLTVAGYYRELADFHKLKFEQSNSLAAASLMLLHASKCPDTATIDLHYLRVSEAKESLDLFIDTHIQKLKSNQGRGAKHHTLYFITGRGLHSNGGPRIKPAVKKRLLERGLNCSEVNPGLLSTRVCADDVLSHQSNSGSPALSSPQHPQAFQPSSVMQVMLAPPEMQTVPPPPGLEMLPDMFQMQPTLFQQLILYSPPIPPSTQQSHHREYTQYFPDPPTFRDQQSQNREYTQYFPDPPTFRDQQITNREYTQYFPDAPTFRDQQIENREYTQYFPDPPTFRDQQITQPIQTGEVYPCCQPLPYVQH